MSESEQSYELGSQQRSCQFLGGVVIRGLAHMRAAKVAAKTVAVAPYVTAELHMPISPPIMHS